MRIRTMEKPVIAALNGVTAGAGCGLALACDIRLAAAGAPLSTAFARVGLACDSGTSFFLPRLVGLGRAFELAFTGDSLSAEEAERIGVRYQRLRTGDQRTLWGSCSPRGTLSFNWRLVLAPFEVLDYVIVHELCHLQVLDHSQRFWQLVEQHRPHWRIQRDWLRMHGPELLAFEACD